MEKCVREITKPATSLTSLKYFIIYFSNSSSQNPLGELTLDKNKQYSINITEKYKFFAVGILKVCMVWDLNPRSFRMTS